MDIERVSIRLCTPFWRLGKLQPFRANAEHAMTGRAGMETYKYPHVVFSQFLCVLGIEFSIAKILALIFTITIVVKDALLSCLYRSMLSPTLTSFSQHRHI